MISLEDRRHHLKNGFFGGWNPQRPDIRDHEFLHTVGEADIAQSEFALNIDGIPLLDQLQQGSCTGHGPSGLVMYDQKIQGLPIVAPSRAMIYYNARIPEGTTNSDSGASVRDAVAGIAKYGVCPDSEFPYNDQVCNLRPNPKQYLDALNQDALVYEAVRYPNINKAIASGFPVVFGFTVYASFMSQEVADTGIVPIPQPNEEIVGGHCTWLWGFNSAYKDTGNNKIPPRTKASRNSWMHEGGPRWGDNGNFYLPQWYFDNNQASDYWIIRRIGPKS